MQKYTCIYSHELIFIDGRGMNRFAHIWHTIKYYCYGPLVHCRVFFFFLSAVGLELATIRSWHWPLDHSRLREYIAIIKFCPHPEEWLCFQNGWTSSVTPSDSGLGHQYYCCDHLSQFLDRLSLAHTSKIAVLKCIYLLGDWATCFNPLDDSRLERRALIPRPHSVLVMWWSTLAYCCGWRKNLNPWWPQYTQSEQVPVTLYLMYSFWYEATICT